MNNSRYIILVCGLLVIGLSIFAQTPYSRLEMKADRFFNQREWAQASATYYQMIELHPEVAATYGKAIVANAVKGDTIAEMDLMVKALNAKIPFDSVLSRVKSTSFQLGKSNLYGDFLLRVREAYPWMRRPVESYLLRYYCYRQDGPKMMEFSRIMLQGDSLNVGFMQSLAQGAMLSGEYSEALSTYNQILEISPDDYNTLIALGNFHLLDIAEADSTLAPIYLSRANKIKSTPYVEKLLKSFDKK